MTTKLRWQWLPFDELDTRCLYQVIRARLDVFVVEQQCVYQDLDQYDLAAWHLLGWSAPGDNLAAYLRALPAGVKYPQTSMGRIMTARDQRGAGLGHLLVEEGLRRVESEWGKVPVTLNAQAYLEAFYEAHGFRACSEPYMEDDILHIEMRREPA